jgi:DNA polymerase-3 subunit epsilon
MSATARRGAETTWRHSLADPKRDIGATSIHGLSASDLVEAPAFAELLPELVQALDGAAFLAAHNARFDAMFLHSEFELAGLAPPPADWLCTMHLSGGGNLATACERWGVAAGTGYEALADARAAAVILAAMLRIDQTFAAATRLG